mmetsp:Transcript_7023/g.19820  ORF Transcript_7023/g.19820 Transcript_7023/m.19820 type:complete len:283 (+) Transcript_7023:1175-2023(+)
MVPRQRSVKAGIRQGTAVNAAFPTATLLSVLRIAELLKDIPLAVLHLTVFPAKARLLDGLCPSGKALVRGTPPGVIGGPELPCAADDGANTAVTAPNEVFHGAELRRRVVHLNLEEVDEGLPQNGVLALVLGGADGVPLEGCVGLWGEVRDGDVHGDVHSPLPALHLQTPDCIHNAKNVFVAFPWEANHEVQLDLVPAPLPGGLHAPEQLLISEALVDDVPQPLCACLGGKGKPAATHTVVNDVGDVVVKAVHPLARQRQTDVVVLEPVFDLNPNRRKGKVV